MAKSTPATNPTTGSPIPPGLSQAAGGNADDHQIMAILAHMSQQQSGSKSRSASASLSNHPSQLPPLPTSPTPIGSTSNALSTSTTNTRAGNRTSPPPRRTTTSSGRYTTATTLRYGSGSEVGSEGDEGDGDGDGDVGMDNDDEDDGGGEYKPKGSSGGSGAGGGSKLPPGYANAFSPGTGVSAGAGAISVLSGAGTASGAVGGAASKKRSRSAEEENGAGGNTASTKQAAAEEYNRTRKDNHKEVERRRRETINDGINELKEIVPGCEKNKGSILQRAVQYIQQLKDAEASNIEKWTLEKLLSDQAMAECRTESESWKNHASSLEAENDTLREENERLRAELVKAGVGIIADDTANGDHGDGKRK